MSSTTTSSPLPGDHNNRPKVSSNPFMPQLKSTSSTPPSTSPLRIAKRGDRNTPLVARRTSSSYKHVRNNNLVSKSPFKSHIPTPAHQHALPSNFPTVVTPTRRVSGEKRPRPISLHADSESEIENARDFGYKRERRQSKGFQGLIQKEPVSKSPFLRESGNSQVQAPLPLTRSVANTPASVPIPIPAAIPIPAVANPNGHTPSRSSLVSRRMHGPRLSNSSLNGLPPRRARRKTVTFDERCDVVEFDREEGESDIELYDDDEWNQQENHEQLTREQIEQGNDAFFQGPAHPRQSNRRMVSATYAPGPPQDDDSYDSIDLDNTPPTPGVFPITFSSFPSMRSESEERDLPPIPQPSSPQGSSFSDSRVSPAFSLPTQAGPHPPSTPPRPARLSRGSTSPGTPQRTPTGSVPTTPVNEIPLGRTTHAERRALAREEGISQTADAPSPSPRKVTRKPVTNIEQAREMENVPMLGRSPTAIKSVYTPQESAPTTPQTTNAELGPYSPGTHIPLGRSTHAERRALARDEGAEKRRDAPSPSPKKPTRKPLMMANEEEEEAFDKKPLQKFENEILNTAHVDDSAKSIYVDPFDLPLLKDEAPLDLSFVGSHPRTSDSFTFSLSRQQSDDKPRELSRMRSNESMDPANLSIGASEVSLTGLEAELELLERKESKAPQCGDEMREDEYEQNAARKDILADIGISASVELAAYCASRSSDVVEAEPPSSAAETSFSSFDSSTASETSARRVVDLTEPLPKRIAPLGVSRTPSPQIPAVPSVTASVSVSRLPVQPGPGLSKIHSMSFSGIGLGSPSLSLRPAHLGNGSSLAKSPSTSSLTSDGSGSHTLVNQGSNGSLRSAAGEVQAHATGESVSSGLSGNGGRMRISREEMRRRLAEKRKGESPGAEVEMGRTTPDIPTPPAFGIGEQSTMMTAATIVEEDVRRRHVPGVDIEDRNEKVTSVCTVMTDISTETAIVQEAEKVLVTPATATVPLSREAESSAAGLLKFDFGGKFGLGGLGSRIGFGLGGASQGVVGVADMSAGQGEVARSNLSERLNALASGVAGSRNVTPSTTPNHASSPAFPSPAPAPVPVPVGSLTSTGGGSRLSMSMGGDVDMDMRSALDRLMDDVAGTSEGGTMSSRGGGAGETTTGDEAYETPDDSMITNPEESFHADLGFGFSKAEGKRPEGIPLRRGVTDSGLLPGAVNSFVPNPVPSRNISGASEPPVVPAKDAIRSREEMILEKRREARRREELESDGYFVGSRRPVPSVAALAAHATEEETSFDLDLDPGRGSGLDVPENARPTRKRSMSTGDADRLRGEARRRSKMMMRGASDDTGLLNGVISADDLLGDTIDRELRKLETPMSKTKYHVREHEETIFASSDDRISHMDSAGDVDGGKAWKTVRRPSDMNEYSKQLKECRAQEKPGKAHGKVFVRVLGITGLDVPIPQQATAVTCTLNNGIHFVTTPEVRLGKSSRIEQEFELIEHSKLEFTLTLKVRRDPHIISQFKAITLAPLPPPPAAPAPSKGGMRGFFMSSPKKSKEKPQAQAPPAIQNIPENLARYLKADGTLARAFISFKDIAQHCDTQLFETSYPLIGQKVDTKGKASAIQVGELSLQLFRLPPLPGIPQDHLPQSLEECQRGLRHLNWHKMTYFEGTLTQNGGDCLGWRRRHLRVIGSNLVAFNDVTKKATATIDLKKAVAVEDDQEPRPEIRSPDSGASGRTSRYVDEYDGIYGVERSFRIIFPRDQEIVFFADSDDEKMRWLEVLRALVGHIPPHPLWAELLWQRQGDQSNRTQAAST